jgi:hypothetical protein
VALAGNIGFGGTLHLAGSLSYPRVDYWQSQKLSGQFQSNSFRAVTFGPIKLCDNVQQVQSGHGL